MWKSKGVSKTSCSPSESGTALVAITPAAWTAAAATSPMQKPAVLAPAMTSGLVRTVLWRLQTRTKVAWEPCPKHVFHICVKTVSVRLWKMMQLCILKGCPVVNLGTSGYSLLVKLRGACIPLHLVTLAEGAYIVICNSGTSAPDVHTTISVLEFFADYVRLDPRQHATVQLGFLIVSSMSGLTEALKPLMFLCRLGSLIHL